MYPCQISQKPGADSFLPPPVAHIHTARTTTLCFKPLHPWFWPLVSNHPCLPGYAMPAFNLAKWASLRASPPHKPPPEGAQRGHGMRGVLQVPFKQQAAHWGPWAISPIQSLPCRLGSYITASRTSFWGSSKATTPLCISKYTGKALPTHCPSPLP